jgi:hypothetical protein
VRVFISGPYSNGDVAANVRAAIDAAEEVLQAGHTPFVPHLCHWWHLVHPHDYDEWMAYTKEWLRQCDCLLWLDGYSDGSGDECHLAGELNMPIYSRAGWRAKFGKVQAT